MIADSSVDEYIYIYILIKELNLVKCRNLSNQLNIIESI